MQPVMFIHQKLLKINTGKMLRILVPLMCVKYIFFDFDEALDLKRILNTLIEYADIAGLTFAT